MERLDPSRQALAKARDFASQGEWLLASGEYKKVSESDPTNVEAMAGWARSIWHYLPRYMNRKLAEEALELSRLSNVLPTTEGIGSMSDDGARVAGEFEAQIRNRRDPASIELSLDLSKYLLVQTTVRNMAGLGFEKIRDSPGDDSAILTIRDDYLRIFPSLSASAHTEPLDSKRGRRVLGDAAQAGLDRSAQHEAMDQSAPNALAQWWRVGSAPRMMAALTMLAAFWLLGGYAGVGQLSFLLLPAVAGVLTKALRLDAVASLLGELKNSLESSVQRSATDFQPSLGVRIARWANTIVGIVDRYTEKIQDPHTQTGVRVAAYAYSTLFLPFVLLIGAGLAASLGSIGLLVFVLVVIFGIRRLQQPEKRGTARPPIPKEGDNVTMEDDLNDPEMLELEREEAKYQQAGRQLDAKRDRCDYCKGKLRRTADIAYFRIVPKAQAPTGARDLQVLREAQHTWGDTMHEPGRYYVVTGGEIDRGFFECQDCGLLYSGAWTLHPGWDTSEWRWDFRRVAALPSLLPCPGHECRFMHEAAALGGLLADPHVVNLRCGRCGHQFK
jgi:hypothetical protein